MLVVITCLFSAWEQFRHFQYYSVVLSSITFRILRTKSGITRHFPTFLTVFHTFRHFPTFLTVFHGFLHFPTFSDIFVHFFTNLLLPLRFSTNSWKNEQKCRKMSESGEIREKLSKTVGKCRKVWKTVKNCRKMSGGTRLVRKMPKVILNNPTSSKSVFIFNF